MSTLTSSFCSADGGAEPVMTQPSSATETTQLTSDPKYSYRTDAY